MHVFNFSILFVFFCIMYPFPSEAINKPLYAQFENIVPRGTAPLRLPPMMEDPDDQPGPSTSIVSPPPEQPEQEAPARAPTFLENALDYIEEPVTGVIQQQFEEELGSQIQSAFMPSSMVPDSIPGMITTVAAPLVAKEIYRVGKTSALILRDYVTSDQGRRHARTAANYTATFMRWTNDYLQDTWGWIYK